MKKENDARVTSVAERQAWVSACPSSHSFALVPVSARQVLCPMPSTLQCVWDARHLLAQTKASDQLSTLTDWMRGDPTLSPERTPP